jgi:small multidrug resistance pump
MLTAAITSEVAATLALKHSDGFTNLLPSAIVVAGYAISFWLLALVLKHLSVGTTYAIWSAVGTAAIALVGIAAYGEAANTLKLASLALIILGVIGLNAAGAH